jgi:DNA-binding MarR family transcriptional regulator
MTTEEQSEQLALLWEMLIMRNEINICTDQLNGTSVLDVNILRVVEKTPEIMIRDIGIILGTSNSTLSSGIKRLEKKGLIARHISKPYC